MVQKYNPARNLTLEYKIVALVKMNLWIHRIGQLGLLLLLVGNSAYSQIEDDKLNVTMELTLPSGRANPAYKAYLNGLVNVQPKFQYKFAKNFFVAAGPKYSYYTISEFKVPVKMNGGAHTYGGFIETGMHRWSTERLALELSCKVGVAQTAFVTDLTRETGIQRVTAMYVEPTFSFVLASDEAVAYRWILGYNFSGYNFQSYHVGLETNGGYTPEDFDQLTQSIIVGFGMSYYFGNERTDLEIFGE